MSRTFSVEPQKTAFGEQSVAELTPVVQVQFPYNINTDIWEIRDNNGASSVVSNMANLSTGAVANQSSAILTRIPVKYNPGQGALVRFTAIYTTGAANSTQYVGVGSTEDGYFFGFDGTAFGILRRQGGKPETRRLPITTPSTTNEDVTITLNSIAETTVTVTNTGDATLTANEIAAHDYSDVGAGWEVHAMGSTVFFTSYASGSKAGTYTLAGATAAGIFAQSLAGVSATDSTVAQTAWSDDVFDGTGPSGVTLDPTKGNVYQIRYQWLGFGLISFYIEDPSDGSYQLAHKIEYANANTVPSVDNPTLPLCVMAKNTSNTSDIVVKVGSMAGFVEGKNSLFGLPHSLSIETGGADATETPVMTIHSHDIYQGTLNRVRARFTLGSVSVDGTKPVTVRVRKNATLTGASFSALDSNKSIMQVDTSATAVSGGTIIFSETVAKDGALSIDLQKLSVDMVAPDFLTLTVETFSGTTDTVATLNWLELF